MSYPGVYIQEISSGSRTITGVSTSVALFIGMAEQGPMDKPVRTLSLTEFERTFGASNSLGELHDQVAQFFINGGATAWVIRIAENAYPSSVTLHAENGTDEVLKLTARSGGLIGNWLRALVDYNTSSPESTFNITIQQLDVDLGGNQVVVAVETFKDLSMNPSAGNYAVDVITNNSELAIAEPGGAGAAQNGYSVWGLLEDGELLLTRLNGEFTAGKTKFNISVDGGAFVPITLLAEHVVSDAALVAGINGQLPPGTTPITIGRVALGTLSAYKFTSGTSGGSVRFTPAATSDLAVAMQMSPAQGGIDVDGYAGLRPAPTGFFPDLLVGSSASFEAQLAAVSAINTTAITVSLTHVDGPTPLNVTWPAVDTAITAGSIADPCLRNIGENLQALVNGVTTAVGATWSAALHGYRVVLTPKYGGDAGDTTAALTSSDTNLNAYMAPVNATRYVFGSGGDYATAGSPAASNGTTPGLPQYEAAFETAEREIDLFNMLLLPKADGQGDPERASLWGPASVFAKSRRAILLVDPPAAWKDRDDVSEGIADLRIGVATDHAALYWPRIKVSSGSGQKPIDPSGAIAGVMARTDASRGVWKAAAGLEANLLGVRGVDQPMSDGDNGVINPLAVNAIRAFPNGIVSWGARTMVGFDNSGNDDYKYLPVRRLALYIEESLYRGLQWAVFEPNDEPLWRQLRQTAGAFMNNLFRLGAFAGAKSSDAYFVKVDRDTTTQNDINLGIVNVMIGFAPLKPAEFVVITLQQKAGEVQT
ncbi:MAG: phage tail sheath subtilisin-like domain-containing protein [Enhygromyxa sp.]